MAVAKDFAALQLFDQNSSPQWVLLPKINALTLQRAIVYTVPPNIQTLYNEQV